MRHALRLVSCLLLPAAGWMAAGPAVSGMEPYQAAGFCMGVCLLPVLITAVAGWRAGLASVLMVTGCVMYVLLAVLSVEDFIGTGAIVSIYAACAAAVLLQHGRKRKRNRNI